MIIDLNYNIFDDDMNLISTYYYDNNGCFRIDLPYRNKFLYENVFIVEKTIYHLINKIIVLIPEHLTISIYDIEEQLVFTYDFNQILTCGISI